MHFNSLLRILLPLAVLLLCQLSDSLVAGKRVLFYNPTPSIRTGQLLVTNKVGRACPTGQMRDHRDRCRRAVIFSKRR